MGLLTLTHVFNTIEPVTPTLVEPDIFWQLHHALGNNQLRLKNITTLFNCPDHGYTAGFLVSDVFSHWGVVMHTSGAGHTSSSALDLRWDGRSQISSYDVDMNIGCINNGLPHIIAEVVTSFEPGVIGGAGFAPEATITRAAPEIAAPLRLTLVLEYDNERAT
jgi:hypothetical protein